MCNLVVGLKQNNLNGIVTMAWKSEFMALGDGEGGVTIWEWRTRHFRPLPHLRTPIKKLRFAPGKNNMKLMVLHADGVDVWDMKEGERLGQWRNASLAVLDADWSASDRPLLAFSDGTLRVFDLSLQKCWSHVPDYARGDATTARSCSSSSSASPSLMARTSLLAIRSALQLNLRDFSQLADGCRTRAQVVDYLTDCRLDDQGTAATEEAHPSDWALLAARRCGDALQCDFWTVASHHLKSRAKRRQQDQLDTAYDLLCDPATYRLMAAERAALYQSKPRVYEQTRQLTRDHLLLDDKDKAIALLLNTDADHDHFYSNHLLACLAAVLQQPSGCQGNAHSTIKLVATHLIASGHVWHGVEILILNGQVGDACRYLQSNNLWHDSARVAKLLLMAGQPTADAETSTGSEAVEIWTKWAQHLAANRQKLAATLVLTTVGAWHKAAELLVQQQMPDAAALLLRTAQLDNIYQPKDDCQLSFLVSVHC